MFRFSNFFAKFEACEEDEHEAMVAGHEDIIMSATFFDYLGNIATAAAEDKERAQQIIATGQRIAAIHEAYARAALDEAKMGLAQEKLASILEVCYMLSTPNNLWHCYSLYGCKEVFYGTFAYQNQILGRCKHWARTYDPNK